MPNPIGSLRYINCTARVAPNLLKAPAIVSDTTVRRSGSWSIRPKTILEIRKKATFYVINKPSTYKFFKDFTNHRKNTNRAVSFSCRPFPTLLNTGTTDEIFQQSEKQDSFKHILKSSASKYEGSGSQFFRTSTGIQSRPLTNHSSLWPF